jgi:hypothetical protein
VLQVQPKRALCQYDVLVLCGISLCLPVLGKRHCGWYCGHGYSNEFQRLSTCPLRPAGQKGGSRQRQLSLKMGCRAAGRVNLALAQEQALACPGSLF